MNSQRRGFERPQVVAPKLNPLQALNIAVGAADLNRVYELNLNDLIIDNDVQVRVDGLDEETVLAYVAILENGGELDPITVIRCDDGEHYVADGFHRVEAHLRVGRFTIEAHVQDGDRDTALDFSEEGNLKHGRPLTNKDKRNVLYRRMARKGHRYQSMSNGDLAVDLGVSSMTIGRWLKEFATITNVIVERSQIVDANGRPMNTTNIGKTPRPTPPSTNNESASDLPPGHSFAPVSTGNGQASAIPDDEMARRYREGEIRRATHKITEGIDDLLQTHSVSILADIPIIARKDLIAVLVGAMVREIQLSQQLVGTLRHDDLLELESMFVRVDRELGNLSVVLQDQIREMGR